MRHIRSFLIISALEDIIFALYKCAHLYRYYYYFKIFVQLGIKDTRGQKLKITRTHRAIR